MDWLKYRNRKYLNCKTLQKREFWNKINNQRLHFLIRKNNFRMQSHLKNNFQKQKMIKLDKK